MMADFHLLRPLWLLAIVPLVLLAWRLFHQTPVMHAWNNVCDTHLLPWLMQVKGRTQRTRPLLLLLTSSLLMIISLTGPTWSRLPVPTYQQIQPRVLVLDMTPEMLVRDLSPDRLSRAKFKLHDLFEHRDAGQFGLVVYTAEPFVVSPLTDDGQTIDALLPSLTPRIMPVTGNRLEKALELAGELIKQAGSQTGQILVLTATPPSQPAVVAAKTLAHHGINTSVIPVLGKTSTSPLFKQLATAGQGEVISFTDTTADLDHWLTISRANQRYGINLQNDIPIWRDQGRWFLIPALILLLPVFRRGWLKRINT